MPQQGSQQWMWDASNLSLGRKKAQPLPHFVPGTSRAPLGRRRPPFRHKLNSEAKRKQKQRWKSKAAKKVLTSQLQVARKRLRRHVLCPNRAEIERRDRTEEERPIRVGDTVRFIPPGPKRARSSWKGEVLAFPDTLKRFVAIDRSRSLHTARYLCLIEVVPTLDAWVES